MKRPAESELERAPLEAREARDSGNPFAGISFFGSGTSASTFSSPAVGLPSKAPPAESGNPFMGLSLFSSPTSGKLFTAAVTTLEKQTDGDLKAAKATKASTNEEQEKEDEPQAEDANEVADANEDGEAAGDDPTGEEDEEVIFRADCKLWKLVKVCPEGEPKSEGWRWQERGCGIVHINRHKTTGAGRLVMRMRGVLKLLLNTPIFPSTRYEKVGEKSVRFVGVDTEESGKEVSFCAFRLNLHSSDQQGKFLAVLGDIVKA